MSGWQAKNKATAAPRDVTLPRAKPNSNWVCGHAELGKCCRFGPTADGKCGRLAAQHLAAGPVESAPESEEFAACVPRRSFWWHRQTMRTNLAILTGGLLLLCMALPSREQTFVPGELSSKHSQILENTLVSQRCGMCHPNDRLLTSGKLFKASLVPEVAFADGKQDELCMKCHREQMPNAGSRNPHDLSKDAWQKILDNKTESPMILVGHSAGPSAAESMSSTNCASCHIEHHGRMVDLKAMADDRCQACHQRRFESLASGHPEFKDFPPQRPRTLAFSHRLHSEKHFPTKNRSFDCQKCHVDATRPTALGPVSRSVAFEDACAECHREPIRAATADGWALLQLPSIDAQAIEKDSALMQWPQAARFGYEGSISPVLRSLLESEPEIAELLAQLPISGQLAELPSFEDQRATVTRKLAIATEQLLARTAERGQAEWRDRLERVTRQRLQRELDDNDRILINAMSAGLPPDLFREAQRAWFESSAQPATNRMAGVVDTDLSTLTPPKRDFLPVAKAGLPLVKPGAPFMKPGLLVERQSAGILISQGALADDDLLLPTAPPKTETAQEGDDLLAPGGTAIGQGNDALLLENTPSQQSGSDRKEDPRSRPKTPVKGPSHLAGGGWYLDHATLAVRYMPTGHADPVLAAWSMWLHKLDKGALSSQVPGGCVQCHRLDISSAATVRETSLSIARVDRNQSWKAFSKPAGLKEFTKFDHGPHLTLPAVKDCRYCHPMNSDHSAGAGRESKGPLSSLESGVHASEFQSIQLSQCVACHRPGGASAGCMQCHNYHIDSALR